jgi:3-mercaptopyruvate sulfurtransferase SseA
MGGESDPDRCLEGVRTGKFGGGASGRRSGGISRLTSTISLAELRRRFSDPDSSVVDVRALAAYNGWRSKGQARGGHIPGAVALPSSWPTRLDDDEVMRLVRSKDIVPGQEIVLYGNSLDETSAVESRLAELGHTAVRVFEQGWGAWAADDTLPAEHLPNYHRLVDPDWLRRLLDGGRPEAAPVRDSLLFQVNFGLPEEYEESHLPGALYLDTNRLESPIVWNRRSPKELDAAVRALGIRHDTTVILYGRDTAGEANEKWPERRGGQVAATRAAMILHYCGVDDVRLLDGGYDAWVQAGNPVETTIRKPVPVPSFGARIPRRPGIFVDINEAKQILVDRNNAALVSVRTWNEQIGQVTGYRYIGTAGRIAGDVWGNRGPQASPAQHYRNIDNTMRAYPEIAASWERAGITPDKRVAFYCGTGWRASETWFYAHLMGWPRIAVYDGGWYEWSQDPINNPIAVGEQTTT